MGADISRTDLSGETPGQMDPEDGWKPSAKLCGPGVEAIPAERIWQVSVFLMPSKLGFRPSADTLPHVPGEPEIHGQGAHADLWTEVQEVLPVSV